MDPEPAFETPAAPEWLTPANGAVAAALAWTTPRCLATPAATLLAAPYDPTGPCQSSGTLRIVEAAMVRSELPMNSSIAPNSPTEAARTSVRVTVRAGARTRLAIARLAAALTSRAPRRR
jgi:hypothetical protein